MAMGHEYRDRGESPDGYIGIKVAFASTVFAILMAVFFGVAAFEVREEIAALWDMP